MISHSAGYFPDLISEHPCAPIAFIKLHKHTQKKDTHTHTYTAAMLGGGGVRI